jgi:UTP--glucose-1-phosphate uridylyltransferase
VRQGDPKGLGHAVLCAEPHVGDEPFAVLLGDDLIDPRDPLLARMIEVQQEHGGSVIALIAVDPEQIHLYGCAATLPVDGESDLVRVTDLVEKPATEAAPSNLAIIGRYVLAPAVFDVLRETQPGRSGEIQLTDALRTLAADPSIGGPVHGVLFNGRRYDTGDRADYLRTIVKLACERDDLGPGFRAWLEEFVAKGFSD